MTATVSSPGMLTVRPFNLDSATDEHPLFVVSAKSLRYFSAHTMRDVIDAHSYHYFEEEAAYVFSLDELELLMERIDGVAVARFPSRTKNVEWIWLKPRKNDSFDWREFGPPLADAHAMLQYGFKTANWSGRGRNDFAYIVSRILSPALKRPIVLSGGYGRPLVVPTGDTFHVYLWSTADRNEHSQIRAPRDAWGYRMDFRDNAFQPNQKNGIFLRYGGYIVAELCENALYVHHNLVRYGSIDEYRLMVKLCTDVVALLGSGEFKTNMDDIRQRQQKMQQEIFATIVESGIPERSQRESFELNAARENAQLARKAFFAAERRVFELEQAQLDPDVVRRRFEGEIAKLQQGRVGLVKGISFGGYGGKPSLHVFTEEIIMTDPRNNLKYRRGEYEIILNFSEGEILFFNRTKSEEIESDPHIESSGDACLGSVEGDITEYLAHYEVEAVTTLAIAFLQSPNPYDGGYGIEHFPLVKEEPTEKVA